MVGTRSRTNFKSRASVRRRLPRIGIFQRIAQTKARNAARVVQKIQERTPRWTVGEILSITRKTGGVSVQVKLQETKRCITNRAKANEVICRKLSATRLPGLWVLYRSCG